jgi:CTP synthase
MQVAVIEFAQNVLGLENADSSEFNPECRNAVIDFMPDQYGDIPKGGTMRLGAYPCAIKPGTMMEKAYGKTLIQERHRHRYEFNNQYREAVEAAGMRITGTSPDGRLVEAVEIPKNDFYVGVQYHPEFKSRPNQAHPLFREFVTAALFVMK